MSDRSFAVPDRYDLARSMRYLAVIPNDPTAARSATARPGGPRGPRTAPVRSASSGAAPRCSRRAYGPGAPWLLARADAIAGLRDDVSGLAAFDHPLVRRLARTFAGVRIPATGRLFHHTVAAILGQKVTGGEASRGYRGLLRHFTAPVPGPAPPRLMLPPDPADVAATPYWQFHPWGIEQKRADTVRRAAAFATRLEKATDPAQATRLLTSVPGIGPWTAAEVVRVAFGDGDAVSVGDYHHKNVVAWALAGEPRGTTTACSNCSNRSAATAAGWSPCSNWPATVPRNSARGCRSAPSPASNEVDPAVVSAGLRRFCAALVGDHNCKIDWCGSLRRPARGGVFGSRCPAAWRGRRWWRRVGGRRVRRRAAGSPRPAGRGGRVGRRGQAGTGGHAGTGGRAGGGG